MVATHGHRRRAQRSSAVAQPELGGARDVRSGGLLAWTIVVMTDSPRRSKPARTRALGTLGVLPTNEVLKASVFPDPLEQWGVEQLEQWQLVHCQCLVH